MILEIASQFPYMYFLQENRRKVPHQRSPTGAVEGGQQGGSYVQSKLSSTKVCELQHLLASDGNFNYLLSSTISSSTLEHMHYLHNVYMHTGNFNPFTCFKCM